MKIITWLTMLDFQDRGRHPIATSTFLLFVINSLSGVTRPDGKEVGGYNTSHLLPSV